MVSPAISSRCSPGGQKTGPAPRTGAWIETVPDGEQPTLAESPLVKGRGSKRWQTYPPPPVRPSPLLQGRGSKLCATKRPGRNTYRRPSYRGVDRNANWEDKTGLQAESPLVQGRGSKLHEGLHELRVHSSPLVQGRGSKPVKLRDKSDPLGSPLVQGRGSKPGLRLPAWKT